MQKSLSHRFILKDLENKKLFYDSKTILQEIVQAHFKEELSYHLVGEEGPDHDKTFQVELSDRRTGLWNRKRTYKKERRTGSCLQDHSDAPQKEYKVGVVCI